MYNCPEVKHIPRFKSKFISNVLLIIVLSAVLLLLGAIPGHATDESTGSLGYIVTSRGYPKRFITSPVYGGDSCFNSNGCPHVIYKWNKDNLYEDILIWISVATSIVLLVDLIKYARNQ
jgi:hypothetical protein